MTAAARQRARRLGRGERVLGHALLVAAVMGAVVVASRPDVRAAATRIAGEAASAVRPVGDADVRFDVGTVEGVRRGAPVYAPGPDGVADVVGHVVAVEDGAEPRVVVRAAVGRELPTGYRLTVHPPRRSLRDAVALAVPDDEARRFADQLATRALALWSEQVAPELERRLPAFLDRIDPTEDTEARKVADVLGAELVARLEPLADELAAHVTREVEKKFDLLDRLGLLWKMVRGDGQGLRRELVPVAKQAAARWWEVNKDRVLGAVGDGLRQQMPLVRAWVEGELLDAALDELVAPIWQAQRPRLEAEAEALLRVAASTFVESPTGGFRVRFATAIRHVLLGKRSALLLLEPAEGP
ncbi:MAG: hypothetical protein KDB73_03455 [Planctomycetes bacterium]|nr:hypothetical protein [Planctomycetota bacterium]